MTAARKSPEIPDRPAKPGPARIPATIITQLESALRRIENHTDAIYLAAQEVAKSQTNLHRHAALFRNDIAIARRDLAELRARTADTKPESPAQNRTADLSSSSSRPASHTDETTERSLAAFYGPSNSPPDKSPDTPTK